MGDKKSCTSSSSPPHSTATTSRPWRGRSARRLFYLPVTELAASTASGFSWSSRRQLPANRTPSSAKSIDSIPSPERASACSDTPQERIRREHARSRVEDRKRNGPAYPMHRWDAYHRGFGRQKLPPKQEAGPNMRFIAASAAVEPGNRSRNAGLSKHSGKGRRARQKPETLGPPPPRPVAQPAETARQAPLPNLPHGGNSVAHSLAGLRNGEHRTSANLLAPTENDATQGASTCRE